MSMYVANYVKTSPAMEGVKKAITEIRSWLGELKAALRKKEKEEAKAHARKSVITSQSLTDNVNLQKSVLELLKSVTKASPPH